MSPAERDLLKFLALNLLNDNIEWCNRPTRGEIRQRLEDLLSKLQLEEIEKAKSERP